jgi:hypothetical protein
MGYMTELGDPLGQKEPAGYHRYDAEHRREEREQTTLNLLSAESGDRRADRYEENRYRRRALFWTRATFVVTLITMCAVIYYAHIADKQRREMKQANKIAQVALSEARNANSTSTKTAIDALKVTRDQLASFQTVEGASLTVSRPTLDAIQIALPIENHGRVPSPKVKAFVHVSRVLSKGGVPFGFASHEFGGDRTLIPPGTGRYGVTVLHGLKAMELEQIEHGEATIWVGVTLRFDNGFGTESQSGFCWRYAAGGRWDACPTVKFADLEKMAPSK